MSESQFVSDFRKKAANKEVTVEQLLECIGTPFAPTPDDPEDYNLCVEIIKEKRPGATVVIEGRTYTIDTYFALWNQGMAMYD